MAEHSLEGRQYYFKTKLTDLAHFMDEEGLLIKGSVHTSQVIMICRLDP